MEAPQRTWTAVIEVRDNLRMTRIAATNSEADLLHDQTEAAVREASCLLDEKHISIHVILVKTTKAHGVRHDRSFQVYRDNRGIVRYQR